MMMMMMMMTMMMMPTSFPVRSVTEQDGAASAEQQQATGALLSRLLCDEEATVTAHLRSAQAVASGRFHSVCAQPKLASADAASAGAPAAAAAEGEAGAGLVADGKDNTTANAVLFLDFGGALLALGVLQSALPLDLEMKWC
jgi:hypothetical protein